MDDGGTPGKLACLRIDPLRPEGGNTLRMVGAEGGGAPGKLILVLGGSLGRFEDGTVSYAGGPGIEVTGPEYTLL